MPELDDSGAPAAGTEGHSLSRRSMLKGAAGVGAAGIAATALAGAAVPAAAVPAAAATKAPVRATRGPEEAKADEAIVVHVRDAASGELDVFRGTTQTRLHDRTLAARIVRASR
jgi:hypothetical protein